MKLPKWLSWLLSALRDISAPFEPEPSLNEVHYALRAGNINKALSILARLPISKCDAHALHEKGVAERDRGQLKNADFYLLAALKRIEKNDLQRGQVLRDLAKLYMSAGLISSALGTLQECHKLFVDIIGRNDDTSKDAKRELGETISYEAIMWHQRDDVEKATELFSLADLQFHDESAERLDNLMSWLKADHRAETIVDGNGESIRITQLALQLAQSGKTRSWTRRVQIRMLRSWMTRWLIKRP